MAKLATNRFAARSTGYSDSDDSGYFGDGSESSGTGNVASDQSLTAFEQAVLQRINPVIRELVRRRKGSKARIVDIPELLEKLGLMRKSYGPFLPPIKGIVQHHRETSALRATAKTFVSEKFTPLGTPLDREPAPGEDWHYWQKKGTMVWHVDLHHFPKADALKHQGKVLSLASRGQILEKSRLFLIIGRVDYEKGYRLQECPIYTYGGKGLRGRWWDTWSEYCSIRYGRTGKFVNQSPGNAVLGLEWMEWHRELSEKSVVRLSDARTRDVYYTDTGKGVQIIGSLSHRAREYASEKLLELMWKTVA